jgi:hypothetical protein
MTPQHYAIAAVSFGILCLCATISMRQINWALPLNCHKLELPSNKKAALKAKTVKKGQKNG